MVATIRGTSDGVVDGGVGGGGAEAQKKEVLCLLKSLAIIGASHNDSCCERGCLEGQGVHRPAQPESES